MEMHPEKKDLEKIQVKWIYKVGASNMLQIAILIFLKLGFEMLENVQLWSIDNLKYASNEFEIWNSTMEISYDMIA